MYRDCKNTVFLNYMSVQNNWMLHPQHADPMKTRASVGFHKSYPMFFPHSVDNNNSQQHSIQYAAPRIDTREKNTTTMSDLNNDSFREAWLKINRGLDAIEHMYVQSRMTELEYLKRLMSMHLSSKQEKQIQQDQTPSSSCQQSSWFTSMDKRLFRGPQGGVYYINSKGKRVYLKKKQLEKLSFNTL